MVDVLTCSVNHDICLVLFPLLHLLLLSDSTAGQVLGGERQIVKLVMVAQCFLLFGVLAVRSGYWGLYVALWRPR